MERLQKYLSRCGVASRRHAEQMIQEGHVCVNGHIVREMGVQVEEAKDTVTVNGREVRPATQKVYYILNKPQAVVTTCEDPQGRKTVLELLPNDLRIYPVGRLDYMTEGLLLLTNDGDLANLLTHPKFKIPKKYLVYVKGYLTDGMIQELCRGIVLEDGPTMPAKLELMERSEAQSSFYLTIFEGRNRQVRRMCETIGLPVIRLRRVQVGTLKLGNLPMGKYRQLTAKEVEQLRQLLLGQDGRTG